ncbi:MAG TPA: amidase family protein [Kofleriaceae bacterium]|jgi:amidase
MTLADQIRRGEVSRRDAIEAAIAKIPPGAVVAERYAEALAEPPVDGPFSGVPTFVKDLSHVKGMPIAWGTKCSTISKRDDPFVKTLRRLGFVILGKSATPELGLTATTEPEGRPPARNPFDAERTTGGSSGGAGALVGGGVVPIAHGSDGGGSIRIPASLCGCVGRKVSRGIADMPGSKLLPINIAVDGVLTATIDDTLAFWHALGIERAEPRALRIGWWDRSPVAVVAVDPATTAAVHATVDACRALGHAVDAIAPPMTEAQLDDFLTYWPFVTWLQIKTARLMMHRGFDRSKLDWWTTGLLEHFAFGATWRAMRRLRAFAKTYRALPYDILLSPVTTEPAPKLGFLGPPYEHAFAALKGFASFTAMQNVVGAPAISIPVASSASGLPIGVQLAGKRGDDATVLALASALTSR